MKIIIVDDSLDCQTLIQTVLHNAGYTELLTFNSGIELLRYLGITCSVEENPNIDLILLDILMPKLDGIKTCYSIKNDSRYNDIPIIIITAQNSVQNFKEAFEAGATDYITKPINKIELLVRVHSALKLKAETDKRKYREIELLQVTHQLEAANTILRHLSSLDGLTGIANRRYFDEFLDEFWRSAVVEGNSISLIFLDIDYFKIYNDTYGHQQWDECLKQIAKTIAEQFKAPDQLVARYGGEEFVVVLPGFAISQAKLAAETIRIAVENLHLPHTHSKVIPFVTVSLGVATIEANGHSPSELIAKADQALYKSKQEGRNTVSIITV